MSEVTFNFYTEPPKSDYSDSVEGTFTIEGTGSEDTTFGLEFAVSQWLNLVTNAENLFSKLVNSKCLSDDEKNQIERWLCLKQECEECVGNDDKSLRECTTRVLERIDELTESDLKSDKSSEMERLSSCNSLESESGSESDIEQNPDFIEKLDGYVNKLKLKTDEKINKLHSKLDPYLLHDIILSSCHPRTNQGPENMKPSYFNSFAAPPKNCLPRRRKSIHPGVEAECIAEAVHQMNLKAWSGKMTSLQHFVGKNNEINLRESGDGQNLESKENDNEEKEPVVQYISAVHNRYIEDVKPLPGPKEELRMLSAGNEAKQSQMCQVLIDLEGAQKRIEELQRTILIKEQFIENMIKNDKMKATAKQSFNKKRIKLESEYFKTRTLIAKAESSLLTAHENNQKEDELKCEREIEKLKNEAIIYDKRLRNIDVMKQIAENSARKMLELENSLQKSRCQMDKLKKQLKKEEEYKHTLEQELLQDQNKIKELEQKYSVQITDREKFAKTEEESRLKWIQEEEERVLSMRESSQRFQEQLMQKQVMLERREAFLKQRLCLEKSKTKSISEVSARISQLNQVLKVKSSDGEMEDKEALRHEIGNLRRTRDCLVDQRCNLDEKFQKEKTLSNVEERKLIECDEAIEAIDAAIEYKNELICGRKGQDLNGPEAPREKGEELLLARLMKLSPVELRSLLYKYFKKVIDLRESGKKMEMQLTELDIQNEAQKWKIQSLSNALQQAHLKAEQHMVMLQKEHEEEMALMLSYFAEESSGSCTEASYGEKNGRIELKGSGLRHIISGNPPPNTKVSKVGNKLVIQQNKTAKSPKR